MCKLLQEPTHISFLARASARLRVTVVVHGPPTITRTVGTRTLAEEGASCTVIAHSVNNNL